MPPHPAAPLVVAVDVETTGLGHHASPPRDDGVVQVGLAHRHLDGDGITSWSMVCNPGDRYVADGRADEALDINGRTVDEVLNAPPATVAADLVRETLTAVEKAHGAPVELRAYNVDFDAPFLRAAPWRLPADRFGPCIMKRAAVHLDGPFGKWPKLGGAMRRLGLEWPDGGAHDAGVDAKAALMVDVALG